MTDDDGLTGTALADFSATLFVIMTVLFVVTATADRPPAGADRLQALTVRIAAPLSGMEQSRLLHARLHPPAHTLLLELHADRIIGVTPQGAVPFDPAGPIPERDAIVFVFDPALYPDLTARLLALGLGWQELTVPQALRGASGFHPEFLSIRVTDDPASIRPELLRLLSAGPAGGDSDHSGADAGQRRDPGALFRLAGNLFALIASTFGLLWLSRWYRHM